MRSFTKIAVLLGLLIAAAPRAEAIPVLQLDMAGGVYDPITQTILAPNGPFTLYAILTPPENATQAQINALLGTTYYVSVALSPPTSQTDPPPSLGSIVFNGNTINVAGDMSYGNPPLETVLALAGFDPNDLAQHGQFPTYYAQFAFTFSSSNTTGPYNTADDPGGPIAGTGAYYASFSGDSSLLAAGYDLHFDLYSSKVCTKDQGPCNAVGDIDVNAFAPFSHDAGTTTVPEPTSVSLLSAGLVGLFVAGRRRRNS